MDTGMTRNNAKILHLSSHNISLNDLHIFLKLKIRIYIERLMARLEQKLFCVGCGLTLVRDSVNK